MHAYVQGLTHVKRWRKNLFPHQGTKHQESNSLKWTKEARVNNTSIPKYAVTVLVHRHAVRMSVILLAIMHRHAI